MSFGISVRNGLAVGLLASTFLSSRSSRNIPASLILNFTDGIYRSSGRNYAFSDIITFTRSTTATFVGSNGLIQTAAINAPRFDYNPVTLAPNGLLIEEQRTNGIRNNTNVGAVAGTPGTVPTNWALGGVSGGLTSQVVGTGSENGANYIDIRIFGTNSSGSSVFPGVFFETTTGVAGTTGQAWAGSVYLSLVAGTGLSFDFAAHEADAGGVFLRSSNFPGTSGIPTAGSLIARRRSGSITLGASTAFVRPVIATTVTSGTSVDFTIRIGLPQLELGAFATSVIPTATAQVTRTADVASMLGSNFSSWYNQSQGTIIPQFVAITTGVNTTGGFAFPFVYEIDSTAASTSNHALVLSSGYGPGWNATTAILGVTQVNLSGTMALGNTSVRKIAYAYQTNNFAASANGGTVLTDTSGTLPTPDRLGIGCQNSDGSNSFTGYIRAFTYYPSRLTNAQLQALTA